MARLARRGPSRSPIDMRAVVVDTFTRADSASALGNSETGQAWTTQGGTWGVTSGLGYPATAANDNRAILDAGGPDRIFRATVTSDDITTRTGVLMFRSIDANNFLFAFVQNGLARLYKVDGGVFSLLSDSAMSTSSNTPYTYQVHAVGTSLRFFVNGVERVAHTLAGGDATKYTAATARYAGIRQGGSGGAIRFDDFRVATL